MIEEIKIKLNKFLGDLNLSFMYVTYDNIIKIIIFIDEDKYYNEIKIK